MDPMHSYSSVQRLSASSLQDAYGYDCLKIAHHILDQNREAEACVTLAIREAAETALPADANALRLCLLRRTRAVSIEHYRAQQRAKRDVSMFLVVLDRLSECVPVRADGLDDSLLWEEEATRAGEAINRFLGRCRGEERDVFICHYFFCEPYTEIASRFGLSSKQLHALLRHTGSKLKKQLEKEGFRPVSSPEVVAYALNRIDDVLLLKAQAPHKKLRRWIPFLVCAACVALLAVSFPYLRQIINTDLTLRGPNFGNKEEGDAEIADKPDENQVHSAGKSVMLGGTTLRLESVTETAATFTVTKTDSTPLYAAVYDRMGDALASTEPDYTVDGVLLRPNTLRVYRDGLDERLFELPAAPGTYTVTVDFTVIRNGTYPMEDYIGLYAYVGEEKTLSALFFSLKPTEEETTAPVTEDVTEAPTAADSNAPEEGA
jgi:RNA polymerase sigma-70 factor (ECF subfamily)